MTRHHSKGGRRIKMEERFNCKSCGANVSEEEMLRDPPNCPFCGITEGWLSDPIWVGFDEED